MTDYVPISCSVHDRLESFATLGTPCRVVHRDERGQTTTTRSTLRDVFARAGAEYVRLDDGTEIRLDRIVSVTPDATTDGAGS